MHKTFTLERNKSVLKDMYLYCMYALEAQRRKNLFYLLKHYQLQNQTLKHVEFISSYQMLLQHGQLCNSKLFRVWRWSRSITTNDWLENLVGKIQVKENFSITKVTWMQSTCTCGVGWCKMRETKHSPGSVRYNRLL